MALSWTQCGQHMLWMQGRYDERNVFCEKNILTFCCFTTTLKWSVGVASVLSAKVSLCWSIHQTVHPKMPSCAVLTEMDLTCLGPDKMNSCNIWREQSEQLHWNQSFLRPIGGTYWATIPTKYRHSRFRPLSCWERKTRDLAPRARVLRCHHRHALRTGGASGGGGAHQWGWHVSGGWHYPWGGLL